MPAFSLSALIRWDNQGLGVVIEHTDVGSGTRSRIHPLGVALNRDRSRIYPQIYPQRSRIPLAWAPASG